MQTEEAFQKTENYNTRNGTKQASEDTEFMFIFCCCF